MRIGIGITTIGREETAKKAIENISILSKGCKIVIIQDVEGIATAKNNCLALLDDCEHIFLFDDDLWPIVSDWYLPYLTAGIKHMSFTFSHLHNGGQNSNRLLLRTENGLSYYQNPCGLMMYIHRDCLDVIGGFDEDYKGYAYEHVDYSIRAYNAGLIPERFIDVENSLNLFYSLDYHQKVKSSVKPEDRGRYIRLNRVRYNQMQESKEWKAYK